MSESHAPARATAIVIAILVLIFGGAIFLLVRGTFSSSNYHAVFLDNDQVYFGKVSRKNSKYLRLTEIYYLQVRQPLQNQQQGSPVPDFSLIKLGNELHGPDDLMEINRDHILFVEPLADNSRVTQAILDYKAQQQK